MSSMGFSIGGGGGGGGFSIGGGGGSVIGVAPKPSGPGLLGEIAHDVVALPEHLISDVGHAAWGFFPGLYDLGKTAITNPAGLGKFAGAVVKQYEDYYGHDVLHHLWAHPLQPILDGLTVATLGLGSAAKIGEVGNIARLARLGQRGELTIRSPEAILNGDGHVITRFTSNKPITRVRQLATQKVRLALDQWARNQGRDFGPIGQLEAKAYGRAISEKGIRKALAESAPMRPYEKAWRKLSKNERIALSTRSMDIAALNLKRFWEGTKNGEDLTPEVMDLMHNPTPKMTVAETHARDLSAAGAELYKQRGALSYESEIDRPGRFKDQVAQMLGHPVDSIHDDPYYMPHTTEAMQGKGSHPMQQVGGGRAEPNRPGTTKANFGELFASGKLDLANDVLGPEFLRRVKWLKFWGIHEALRRGAVRMSWDRLHELHPSGRPPKGYSFLRTSVMIRDSDRVRVLLRKARDRNERFPNFNNAQRVRSLEQELNRYESGFKPDRARLGKQKIPFSIRGQGEHSIYERLIPNPEDLHDSALSEGFMTRDIAHAATDESGNYFLVPDRMSKAATGEFTRMSDFMYKWGRQPLRIWRALLLGARPAFLVNNLIGNSLMYTMKTGGKGAIRDLAMAMRESHPGYLKKLLDDPSVPPDVRMDLYREFFPEQMSGTMGLTQSPSTEGLLRGATSKVGRGFERATGALPAFTSKVAEEAFRRGLIRNFIRNSPEFKQVWRNMPGETRTFTGAARELLTGDKGEAFQQRISQQVDEALGNYTRLSPVERNLFRNVFPFYAWYRAILSTTVHLGVDNPLRAQLLFRLGSIGAETAAGHVGALPLPSYLQGAIPLGAGPRGTQRLLATQGLNPWGTLTQIGRGVTSDLTSLGINPFVVGAFETFKKLASAPGGATKAVTVQALLTDMLGTIAKGLPPYAQLFPAGPSRLYPNRGYQSALEAWAGAPIKEVNPYIAAQYAAAGQ